MQPTTAYRWFYQARERGSTVAKMMTGQDCPLSNLEDVLWTRFATAEARIQEQARKGRKG